MTYISPISVALVDDYLPIRKFLTAYLSNHGFVISHQAENGHHLLQQLEDCSQMPDLCLLDITMPVMDGYETALRLREKYPEIQILAYSCLEDQLRIDKILESGAHSFISKDSGPEKVRDALINLQINACSTSNRTYAQLAA